MNAELKNERGTLSVHWGNDMSVQITIDDYGPQGQCGTMNEHATAHLRTPAEMRWLAEQLLAAARMAETHDA